LTVSGNMSAFVQMPGDGHVLLDGATISMPNVLTFFAFFQLNGPANVSATSMTFTGAGSGAASTGAQWLIDRYTNLNIASSVIPELAMGSTTATCRQCVHLRYKHHLYPCHLQWLIPSSART